MATPPRTPTGPRPLISGECSSITSPHDSLAWGQSQTGANGSKGYFLQFEAPKAVLSARRKRSKSAGTRLSADARSTAEAVPEEPRSANGTTAGSPCLTTSRGDRELIAPEAGSVAQPDRVPNRAQSKRTDASSSVKRRKEESDDDAGRNIVRQQETEQYSVRSHSSARSASDGKVAVQRQRHHDQKQTTRRPTVASQVTAASLAGLASGSRSAAARRPSKKSSTPGPVGGSANGRRNVEQLASNAPPTASHGDERPIVAEVQTSPGSCCNNNDIADDGLMPTDWDELADECSALAQEMLDTRDSVTPTSSDGDGSGGSNGDFPVEAAATTAATDSGLHHWWPPEGSVEEQQVVSVAAAAVTLETSSPALLEHRELSTSCPSFDGKDACWRASVCSELRGDILSNAEHAGQPAAYNLTVGLGNSLEEERLLPAGEFVADYAEAPSYIEYSDHNGRPGAQEEPPPALQGLRQQQQQQQQQEQKQQQQQQQEQKQQQLLLQQLPPQQLCSAICTPDDHCTVATSEICQTVSSCTTPTLTPVRCDRQLENDASMTVSDCPAHAQNTGDLRREPANLASADRSLPPTVTRCSSMELEPEAVAELIEQPFISYSVVSVEENAAAVASYTPAVVCHSSSLCTHAQEPAQTRSFFPVQMDAAEAVDVDEPASCVCTIERREDMFEESSTISLRDKALPEADPEDVLNVIEDGDAALDTVVCRPEEFDRLSTDGGSVSLYTVVDGGCLQRADAAAITTAAASLLQSDAGSSTSSCETDSQAGVEATVMQSNEYIKHAEPDRLQFVPVSPRLSRKRKGRPSNVNRRSRDQEQRRRTVEALLTAEAEGAAETAVAEAVAGSQGAAVTNTSELVPESVTLVASGLGDRPDSSAVTSSAQATHEETALHRRVPTEGEGMMEIDPNAFGGQSDDGRTQMPFLIHDNKKNNEPQGDREDRANGRSDRTSSYPTTAGASVAAEGGGLNGRMAAAKWISLLKEDLANDEWHSSTDSAPEDDQHGMSSKSLTQRTNFGCDARRGNEVGSSFDEEDWEEEQTFGEIENLTHCETQTTAAAKPDDEDAIEISGSVPHRKHTATAARIRAHAEERRQEQMRGSSSSSDEEHDGGGSGQQGPAARSSFGHPTAGPIAASRRHYATDFTADTGSVGCSQAKRPCNSTSIAADAHLSAERFTLPDVPDSIHPHQPDGRRPYGEAMSDSESSSISLSSDPATDRLVAQRPGSIALKSADAGTDRTLQPAVAGSSHLALSSSPSLVPRELPAGDRLQYEQLPEALQQQQQQSRPLRGILKNSGARPIDHLREQSASHCDLSVLEFLRSTVPPTSGSLSHAKSTPAMFDTATARSADQLADAAHLSDSDKQPAGASKAQPKKGAASSGSSSSNSAKELLQERLQGSIRDWRNMTAQSVEGKIFEWESTGDFRVHIKQSAPARKEANELGQILRRFASKAESSGQQPAGDEPAKTSLVRSKSVPVVSVAEQQQQQQQHSSKHEVTSSATSLVLDRASTPNRPNDAAEERLPANEMEEHEEDTRRTFKPEVASSSVGSRAAERASTTFRVHMANGPAEPSSTGVYHARTFSSDWSDCGLDETPLHPQTEGQEVDVEDAFDEAPKRGQHPVEPLERLPRETSQTEEPLRDDESQQQQQQLRQHDELDRRVALVLELHSEVAQPEQQWTSDDRSQRQLMQSEDEQRLRERPLQEESLERIAVQQQEQLLLDNAQQRHLWEQGGQQQQQQLSDQEQQQQLWDDEQWHSQEQLHLQEQTHLQEQKQRLLLEQEQLQRQELVKQEQLWTQEQQQLWEQEQQRLWDQEQQRLWEQEQQRLWEQEQQRLWEQEQQQQWEQEQQQLWEQEQARQQELLQEQQQHELRQLQGQEKLLEQEQQQQYLLEQDRQLQDKWKQELWAQTRQHEHEVELMLPRQDEQQHFWTDEQLVREQRQGERQQWEDEQQQDQGVLDEQRWENDEQKDQQEQRKWEDEQQQDQGELEQRQWEDEQQQDQEKQEQWEDEHQGDQEEQEQWENEHQEQEQWENEQQQDRVKQRQVQQDLWEQERRRPPILAEAAKPLEAHVPQVLPTERRERQMLQGGFDSLESPCVSYEEEYDSGSSDSGLIQPGVVRSLVSDGLLDAKVAEEMQPKDRRGDRPDFQTQQKGVDGPPDVNRGSFIETQQQQQPQVTATVTTVVDAEGVSIELRTADSDSSNEEHCLVGESLPDETCDVYRDGLSVSKSSQSADEDEEQIIDDSSTHLRPSGLRKWPTGVNLVSPDDAAFFSVRELHSSPSWSAMQEANRLSMSADRYISEIPADSNTLASSAGSFTERISVTSVHGHPDATGGSSSIQLSDSLNGNLAVSDMSSDIGNVSSNDDGGKGMTAADTGFPAYDRGLLISDSPSTGAGSACQTTLPQREQGQSRTETTDATAGAASQTSSQPLVSERPEARDLAHSTLKLPVPATRHSLRRSREQPGESGEAASSELATVEASAMLASTPPHRSQQRLLKDDEHSVVKSGTLSIEMTAASTSAEHLPAAADRYGTDAPLRHRDYSIGAATDVAEPRAADEAAAHYVSLSEPRQLAAERTSLAFLQATSPEATVFADAFKFAVAGTASPVLRDWQATEVTANESLRNASKAAAPADRYRSLSPSILPANVSPTGSNDVLPQGTVALLEQQSAGTASSKTTGFLTSGSALAARVQTGGAKYKVAEFVSQIEANSGKCEDAPGKSSLKSHKITSAKSIETIGAHLESIAQPPAGSLGVPSGKEPAAVAADMSNDAASSTVATKPFFDRQEAEWYGQVGAEEPPTRLTMELRQSSTTGTAHPAQTLEELAGSSCRSASVEELHRITATGDDRSSLAISRTTVTHSSKPTLKQAADAVQSNMAGSHTTADMGSVHLPPGYGQRSSSYDTAIFSKEPLDGQHKELYAGTSSEETLVSTRVTSTVPLSRSSDAVQSKVVEAMSFSSPSSGDRKALGLIAQDGKHQPTPGKPSQSSQLVSSPRGRQRMDASKVQGGVDMRSATLDSPSSTAAALSSSVQSVPVDSLVNRVLRDRPQDGVASLRGSESSVPSRPTRAGGSVFVSTDADDLATHTNRGVRLAVPTGVLDRRVGAESRQEGGERDSGRTARIAESPRLVGADADLAAGSGASRNSNGSSVVGGGSTDTKSAWAAMAAAAATASETDVVSHDQQSYLVAATTVAPPTFAKLETKDTDPDRFYQQREQRKKIMMQRRRDFVLTCDTIEETHHDDNVSVSSTDTDELIKARSVAVLQPSCSAYTDSDEEQVPILRETETIQPEPQIRANNLVTASSITSILSARPFVKVSSPAITTFGVKVNAESRTPVRVPDRAQDDEVRTLPAADGKAAAAADSSNCQVYFARPAIVRTDDREDRSSKPGDFDQLRVGSNGQSATDSVVTKQASASSLQASVQLKEFNAVRLTDSTTERWAAGAVSGSPLQTAKSSQQHSKKTDSRKDETLSDAYAASVARAESNATSVTGAAPTEPLYHATVKRTEASPTTADYDYARVYKVLPMPKPSVASISSPTSDSYDFHFARPFTNPPAPVQRVPPSAAVAAATADHLMHNKEANHESRGARADPTSQYLKDAARMNVLTAISNRSSMNYTYNSTTGFGSASPVEQSSKLLDGNSERGDDRLVVSGHPAPSVDSRSTAGSTWAQQSGSSSYSLPASYHPAHVQQSVRNQSQASGSVFGAASANAHFGAIGSASRNSNEFDSSRPAAPLAGAAKPAAEPVARSSRSAEVKQTVGSGESTVRTLPPWERSKSLDRSTASRNRREQDRKNDREPASAIRTHNAFPQQQQQAPAAAAAAPAAYKALSSHDDNAYVELRYASSSAPRTAQYTVNSPATPRRSGNAPKLADTSVKPFSVSIPRSGSGSAEYSNDSRASETVAHVTANGRAVATQQRPAARPSHSLAELASAGRPAVSYRTAPSFENASTVPAGATTMPDNRAAFVPRDASGHAEQQRTAAGRHAAASSRYETTADFDHLDPLAASAQQSLKRRPRASDEIAELEEMYARLEVAVDDLTRRQYMLESIDVVDVCLGRQSDGAAQPPGAGRSQRHDRERIEQPSYPTPSAPSSAIDKSTAPEQLVSGRAPQRDQQRAAAHGQYASSSSTVNSGGHRSATPDGRREDRIHVYQQYAEAAFSQAPAPRRMMANPEAGGSQSQLANAAPEYSPLRSLPQQYRQSYGRQQPEPQAHSRAEPARAELAATMRPVALEQVPQPHVRYVHPGPWLAAPMPAGGAASNALPQSGARPDARIAPSTEQTPPARPAKGAAMLAELYTVRDRPNGPSGPVEPGYYQSLGRYPTESPARVSAAPANARQEQALPLSRGNATPMNPLWIRTDSNAEVPASRDRPPLPAPAFQANPFRDDRFSEHTDSRRIQAGGPSSSAQLLMPVAVAPPREIWL